MEAPDGDMARVGDTKPMPIVLQGWLSSLVVANAESNPMDSLSCQQAESEMKKGGPSSG